MKAILLVFCITSISFSAFSQGSCPDQITSQQQLPNPSGTGYMSCTTGGYLKTDSRYNCHQYVRAAVDGKVNKDTGNPVSGESSYYTTYCAQTIRADQNFLKVNLKSDAVALACIGNSADHSAFILTGGAYTCTPNGGSAYVSSSFFELNCSNGGVAWEFYAYIKDITLEGTPSLYMSYPVTTFSLRKGGSSTLPSYVHYSSSNWQYDTYYWELVSYDDVNKSITLRALRTTPPTGSTRVTYKLQTPYTNTGYFPTRNKDVKIYPSCEGKLDGGSLGTFNSVCSSKEHIVTMDYVTSWTWVKTSGSPSYWFTSNAGQKLTFKITSGCVTFNGYNSGCNVTRTFCSSSCLMTLPTTSRTYEVLDMRTLHVVRKGTLAEDEASEAATNGLSPGMYLFISGNSRSRIVITK